MRILVCGDRDWTDEALVRDVLRELRPAIIIEGGQRGADACARNVAEAITGKPSLRFDADWLALGKAAGPIRNAKMLREGQPDLVLAFHDDLRRSKGTRDMLARAERAGVTTRIVCHPNSQQAMCASRFEHLSPLDL